MITQKDINRLSKQLEKFRILSLELIALLEKFLYEVESDMKHRKIR